MNEHRLGITPGFLTKHKLSLNGLDDNNAKAIQEELEDLPCVDGVKMNQDKGILKIAYDASHHNIDEMIAIVQKHGATLKDTWWTRVRLSLQRQTDENIKSNASHEVHCCNKVPRR